MQTGYKNKAEKVRKLVYDVMHRNIPELDKAKALTEIARAEDYSIQRIISFTGSFGEFIERDKQILARADYELFPNYPNQYRLQQKYPNRIIRRSMKHGCFFEGYNESKE